MKTSCRGLLAALLLTVSRVLHAELLALAWDNDIFFNTDGNYTNGLRISWLSDEQTANSCSRCQLVEAAQSFNFLPGWGGKESRYSMSWSLQQLMVTPSNISLSKPQYQDTPYAGVLRLELGLFARHQQQVTGYGVTLGATGQASLAEQSQKLVHNLTDSTHPQGWGHQLPDKPVVGFSGIHARLINRWSKNNLEGEFGWGAAGELDSWMVQVQGGVFVKIGHNLSANLLPAYSVLGSAASLPGLYTSHLAGWSLHAGIKAQHLLWSYLQEEGRKAGYIQGKQNTLAAGFVGASLHSRGLLLAISLEKSTPIGELGGKTINFGSLGLTWSY
ncbi:lipid A deacylase LpxR family protein [Marinospirillum sp.]|uniref:lipid A deacylase LpxR family protein n=1 Tax=Marinospirillum sp. TaxID=2183934 RepID=UPI0028702EA9|nr:lipid A deacylase LpxR family protein [Marinospirillum sp.]MDR9467586.1 lipid A deacylase LpxR family protein [Marinospirillum sp.]